MGRGVSVRTCCGTPSDERSFSPHSRECVYYGRPTPPTGGPFPLAARGAMGHYGSDDYASCTNTDHWERVPRLHDDRGQVRGTVETAALRARYGTEGE